MPDTPITPASLLAVVSSTAHAIPWLRGPAAIRPFSIREFLQLSVDHPTLLVLGESHEGKTFNEVFGLVGRPAAAALVGCCMQVSPSTLNGVGDDALTHALYHAVVLSLGEHAIGDFFPPRASKFGETASSGTSEVSDGLTYKSMIVQLVRSAVEYQVRTGRDGLDMSPVQLAFASRVFADVDRGHTQEMFLAVAAGMGSKEAHEALMES